ncbi:MAG TPA: RNA polymerase sigma-70 factor [Thermomicrobiales bacterium]|nr:RNA polymerase sigma-70 factor [Thermomicrobiales bacterium]
MTNTTMQDAEIFARQRPHLFAIAYRMLGSVQDAEDVVQEAYLQWQRRADGVVASPRSFLSTIVTRQSINHLNAARTRRETYPGPWLPEPIVSEGEPDLAETAALHESLSMAFLALLERLTPVERAIFLLHDVFAYDFHEIAGIVGKGEANCRQIARRARRQIQAGRPRFDPDPARREQLTRQFIAACNDGDLDGLLATLAADATLWTDGGGKATAALRPVVGAERVAAFILGIMRKVPGTVQRRAMVNGQPGFTVTTAEGGAAVLTLDIADGRIQAIRAIANPDKLRALDRAPERPRAP